MDAPEPADGQPTPEPTACERCGYDRAGLPPGAVCPECGLDVVVPEPGWSLRGCHPSALAHLREELGALGTAAVAFGLAPLMAMAALLLGRSSVRLVDPVIAGVAVGVVAIVPAIVSGVMLGGLRTLLARHPGGARAPGGDRRRALARDAALANTVLTLTLLVGGGLLATLFFPGVLVVVAGVLGWLGCAAMVCLTGGAYVDQVRQRAGAARLPPVLAYAAALLPFAGIALAVLTLLGVRPGAWLHVAVLLGVALGAGVLAVRCARARRLLGRLIASSG